jgi:hypothetical protein
MNDYSRVSTMVVAVAVALLASACTSPVAGAAPSARPTATIDATPQPISSGIADLKAGTYAFAFPRLDEPGKPFPSAVITVAGGWRSYKGFAIQSRIDTPRQLGLSFWDVTDVYANSCHWLGPMIHPGPTVDGLAVVLAARPLRNATTPVAVSLGGYHGKYLEWSVPVDMHFSDCDMGPGDTQGWFESWTSKGMSGPPSTGDRYQQGPGQVDRLWILDVKGRRLVIDATYMPGATNQDRAVLQQVVDSIAFKP